MPNVSKALALEVKQIKKAWVRPQDATGPRLSRTKIAKKLGVTFSKVRYWTDEQFRQRIIKNQTERQKTREYKEKRKIAFEEAKRRSLEANEPVRKSKR